MAQVKTREAQVQPRDIQVNTREAQHQPRKDHIEAREAQVQTREALVIFHKRAAVALGALLKPHSTGMKNNVETNIFLLSVLSPICLFVSGQSHRLREKVR